LSAAPLTPSISGVAAPYHSPNAADIPASFKDAEGYWMGFSARARVLIINRRVQEKPTSILAYTDPHWKGKALIANSMFGTTTTQVATFYLPLG
jgi:iron(III) transport system substrate-binding protein